MNIPTEAIALTQDELMTISGGRGAMIDPNGNPATSGDGEEGTGIDPHG